MTKRKEVQLTEAQQRRKKFYENQALKPKPVRVAFKPKRKVAQKPKFTAQQMKDSTRHKRARQTSEAMKVS